MLSSLFLDNSIADEENVEKILDAQIQSKEVERRQIELENKGNKNRLIAL